MNRLLLIANKIPHYRVSVYNYLGHRFRQFGWDLYVASDYLLRETDQKLDFTFFQIDFEFSRYYRLLRELQPSAVILHLHLKVQMFWPLIHYLKLRKVPVISWTKGANLDHVDSKWRHEMFNYLHYLSDAILMYSFNEMRYLKRRYRRKTFVANNTVNFGDYPLVTRSKREIKSALQIPFEKVVLFVGTMGIGAGRKRVRHLIDIFSCLKRGDAGLVLVGAGISEADKNAIDRRNTCLLGAVHDRGNRTISELFSVADIYVVPGHVGLGINQAFFWGVPVITENCNQPPEVHYLKSGRNGFLVDDNDINELRTKVLELLDNQDMRAEFSRNARNDIVRNAPIEGMFRSFFRAVEYALDLKEKYRSFPSKFDSAERVALVY